MNYTRIFMQIFNMNGKNASQMLSHAFGQGAAFLPFYFKKTYNVPTAWELCGESQPNMKKRDVGTWAALAFAIGFVYLFNIKGMKFYLVPSDSMEPTLKRSDYIGGFEIEPTELLRGDIVVFSGERKGDYYIKRVVGLPDETLTIFMGMVYINDRKLEEPYVAHRNSENSDPIRIPDDQVFLMGDNRTNSIDSRRYGPVAITRITAKASFIYNPISRIGRIQ